MRHAAVEGGPDLVPVHVEGDAELAPLPQQVVVEERVVEAELVDLQSRYGDVVVVVVVVDLVEVHEAHPALPAPQQQQSLVLVITRQGRGDLQQTNAVKCS